MVHGINRRLVSDYQKYLLQTLSLACSDLKFYYDRFVHSSASLALKRIGIPFPSIISMLDKIQRMSNMSRMAYWGSNLTYGGDTIPDKFRHFMMRLCQVNGCSPQIWSIISSIILSALRTQGFGVHLLNSFTT